jgi:molybdenum cofactor biosynthesis protein B
MIKVPELHKHMSPKSVGISIVTCSSSKFAEMRAGENVDDKSGNIIENLVLKAGHRVEVRCLISDSKPMIRKNVRKALSSPKVDALIITGGTGLSPRDLTIESVSPFLQKNIPGFGELFRKISFDKIGSAAMLSRALAGSSKGKLIFCLPGSPDAVETAVTQLILPEIGHMLKVSREH